jgi:hypothetical protein
MALSGSDKAYLQARSAIARSGASRSNYIFPLFGYVTVGGLDVTPYIRYGSLRVTQQLNDQPDTASFDILLTDQWAQSKPVVGQDVLISLGGPSENVLFGGRILTTQTTWAPGRTPTVRSVLCADYLQVLDSELLVTYGWPAQSTTVTILDLFKRFASRTGDNVPISMAAVAADLPGHAAFTVVNEKFSTVLRRLVTMFATGGGFYIDPLKVLHVWQGASEPNRVNPRPLTIDLPTLKGFAETIDGSQHRDAVLVEGRRTTAPLGLPAVPVPGSGPPILTSLPVIDASIGLPPAEPGSATEVRIGSQRVYVSDFIGPWKAPADTPQTTTVTADVPFNPDPGVENNSVTIPVASTVFMTGRATPWAWVRIDDQYLRVDNWAAAWIVVPRTGFGAMVGPISANTAVSTVDSLGHLTTTSRYEFEYPQQAPHEESLRAQPVDADVVLTVRSTEAALSIHEHLVQDGRYTRPGATSRGQQEVADFKAYTKAIDFETEDLNAKPGRLIAYSFDVGHPFLTPTTGEFMILSSDITWPVWGQVPRIRCHAAKVETPDVTETWLTDLR